MKRINALASSRNYIDIDPISYKSPEFNRKNGGVYYRESPYKRFRQAMIALAPSLVPEKWRKFKGAVKVVINVVKDKPKTTKRSYPQGDVDNYAKGINDRLNNIVWEDDDQIVDLRITKQWATKKRPTGIYIKVISL